MQKWFPWAGLVLTVMGSIMAFTGYLRLGQPNVLKAAQYDDPVWKAKDAPVTNAPVPAPVVKSEDPFKAKTDPAANRPPLGVKVQAVMDTYRAPEVQQVRLQLPALPEPKAEQPPVLKLDPPGVVPPAVVPPAVVPPVRPEEPKMLPTEQIQSKPKPVAPPSNIRRDVDDEALLTAARTAVEQQKYDIAAERFERYLAKHPDDLDIRGEYAGILITAGQPRLAAQQFEKLLAADPTNISNRQQLATIYSISKDYRRAIVQFTEALELNKKDTNDERRYRNELKLAVSLARNYAFDRDFTRAEQVYDRFLATVKPDEPVAPSTMGGLLLDLERPGEALAFLLAQKKRTPENLSILTDIVRAYARLGEMTTAMDQLVALSRVDPKNKSERLVLANSLFDAEIFDLAGHAYEQILQIESGNGDALVGLARVFLSMYMPSKAKSILDQFTPLPNVQRLYLLTYAEYHQVVGEYTEAKLIYRDMLRRNEGDHEVRYALGVLYDYVKEWEKAKAEFAKIPPSFPRFGKKARLGFANTLFNQRKFQEAVDVTRTILVEDPNDVDVISQLIREMAKAGQCDQAIAMARGYLAGNVKSETAAIAIRGALARVLLESNRYLDASREYEIILSKPIGRVPAAYYGLARAAEKMGNVQRAADLIGCLTGVLGGDTRNRLLLADQFSIDFDDTKVLELTTGALQFDPNNLAVLIRLADALQRSSRYTGQPQAAFDVCIRILNLSPTNVRGHLAMARSFAIAQNYRKSAAQYEQLIQIDPEFTIPPRERARVLYADHQYSAARSQYQVMLSPTPEQKLTGDLAGVIQRQPKVRGILEPYMMTSLSGVALRREMEKMAAALPEEEARLAVLRLVNDYDAKVAEQNAFRMEMEAKELKDYRNYLALPAYDAINRYEPTNTETLFDMGQVYGALTMTRNALELYNGTLAVDPTHRDSMVAIERASAELNPSINAGGDYFTQRGRDGLASIDRARAGVSAKLPFGDENEYVQIGYDHVVYSPIDDTKLDGNIPWLRVQKKFDDNRLLLYAQLNIEIFPDRFHTRPTFDVGFEYQHDDCLKTRGGLYLDNVAENGESLRQDIHRFGVYAGADFHMTRTWDFGGTYTYGNYSDHNNMNRLDLYNQVELTLPPKELKLVEQYTFYGYSDPTVFPTTPPNPLNLFGTIHPYFAPKTYNYLEARLEWWHWFSRDTFIHSDQCWYSLQYGIGTDDRLVTYNNFKGMVNWDICSWLTLTAQARVQLSTVYNATEAMAYLTIRFK